MFNVFIFTYLTSIMLFLFPAGHFLSDDKADKAWGTILIGVIPILNTICILVILIALTLDSIQGKKNDC